MVSGSGRAVRPLPSMSHLCNHLCNHPDPRYDPALSDSEEEEADSVFGLGGHVRDGYYGPSFQLRRPSRDALRASRSQMSFSSYFSTRSQSSRHNNPQPVRADQEIVGSSVKSLRRESAETKPLSESEGSAKEKGHGGTVEERGISEAENAEHDEEGDVKEPDESQKPTEGPGPDDESQYPGTKKVVTIVVGMLLTTFLVVMDRSIIATAIPAITDTFHSLSDIGWYGAAYMLSGAILQLPFGRLYTLYSTRTVYVVSSLLFLSGSAICGAAPNSAIFILGRAVAGIGGTGITQGNQNVIVAILPLRKRPSFMSAFFALFAVGGIIGPLIGGALTTKASWRWCFYLNLPIGAPTILLILLFVRTPPKPKVQDTTSSSRPLILRHLFLLDPLGLLLLTPATLLLLLALQWAGQTHPWRSPLIIALLATSALCLALFILSQLRHATRVSPVLLPGRIFRSRSMSCALLYTFFAAATMMMALYYLPIFHQAARGASALQSGIDVLPMLGPMIATAGASGFGTQRLGYYTPFLMASGAVLTIGSGLLTLLHPGSQVGQWVSYEVVLGVGLGMGMQQAALCAQTVLQGKDVPMGIALIFFAQSLAGSLSLAGAQNVFVNVLLAKLQRVRGLEVDRTELMDGGVGALVGLPAQDAMAVKDAVSDAVKDVFWVCVGCAMLSYLGALGVEWKSIKKKKDPRSVGEKDGDVEKKSEAHGMAEGGEDGKEETMEVTAQGGEHGKEEPTAVAAEAERSSSGSGGDMDRPERAANGQAGTADIE